MGEPTEPPSLNELIARGYTVKPFDYLEEGWHAFTRYPLGFSAFALLLLVLSQALPLLSPGLGQLLSLAIQVVMLAGIALVTWTQLQSKPARFSDFFPDGSTILQLILCTVVGLLLVVVGLMLFVVPGIYLMVGYTFSYLLIVDRRLGVWQALEGSRRVVTKNWWAIFGLVALMLLLILGGALVGGVVLGFPLGYLLAGFFPEVSLDELPMAIPETGATINLGILIGLISGIMVGAGLATAVTGCTIGAAYADIFKLANEPKTMKNLLTKPDA